jgi:hypothetical protein
MQRWRVDSAIIFLCSLQTQLISRSSYQLEVKRRPGSPQMGIHLGDLDDHTQISVRFSSCSSLVCRAIHFFQTGLHLLIVWQVGIQPYILLNARIPRPFSPIPIVVTLGIRTAVFSIPSYDTGYALMSYI